MRLRLVLSFLILAFLVAQPVRAAPADPQGVLRAELALRQSTDFPAPLDKTHKKQLKAVTSALKSLDLPAPDFAARTKNDAAAVKTLAKAFPLEFAKTKATTSLKLLADALFASLLAEANARFTPFALAVPGMQSPKLRAKAQKQVSLAAVALAQADTATTAAAGLAFVAKAAAAIQKGLGYVAAEPKHDVVSADLGGEGPFVAQNITVTYTALTTTTGLVVVDANTQTPGRLVTLQVQASGLDPVTGPGTFHNVTVIVRISADPGSPVTKSYYANDATLVLDEFDIATQRVKGSFTSTSLGGTDFAVTGGVVDTTKWTAN